MRNAKPVVSIICTAYNHEKYIAQTLDGFLIQKTNFPFEIIVHEDASTDSTASIIRAYEAKYPDLFVTIYQKENQYSKKNVNIRSDIVLALVRGEYVAFCEGDDYWIDPYKLQKQVEFLEKHSDYVLIHSDCHVVNENGKYIKNIIDSNKKLLMKGKKGKITKYLVKGNYIMTLTILVKSAALFEAERRIRENDNLVANIDYTLFLELSVLGSIFFDTNKTAAYRVLAESASRSTNLEKRLEFVTKTIDISRFYCHKYSISISDNYFNRVQLSAEIKELAIRKLPKKLFYSLFMGVKSDYLNAFRLKNYYYLLILIYQYLKVNHNNE